MTSILKLVRSATLPAILSSLLVLPFAILEVKNRQSYPGGFPIPLFVFMWLLPLSFILVLTPIVRHLRTEKGGANFPALLPKVVLLVVIAWLWIGVVVDQTPCFLGVPNCD